MLILSRNIHESIIINGNIRITLLKINNYHTVKLAIDAPEDVVVHREEVHKQLSRAPTPGNADHERSQQTKT